MLRSLVSYSMIMGTLIAVGFASEAERTESGELATSGSDDAFALQGGDCFNDQSGTEVNDVPGVPCSEPHDNEIFAAFDLEPGAWPGEEAVSELADTGCMERFEPAIGAIYDESVLVVSHLVPTQQSWETRTERGTGTGPPQNPTLQDNPTAPGWRRLSRSFRIPGHSCLGPRRCATRG